MSPEREWGYRFYCHSCKKDLEDLTAMNAHLNLEHKADKYVTMPKDVDRRIAPKEETPRTFTIKDEIRKDYAEEWVDEGPDLIEEGDN